MQGLPSAPAQVAASEQHSDHLVAGTGPTLAVTSAAGIPDIPGFRWKGLCSQTLLHCQRSPSRGRQEPGASPTLVSRRATPSSPPSRAPPLPSLWTSPCWPHPASSQQTTRPHQLRHPLTPRLPTTPRPPMKRIPSRSSHCQKKTRMTWKSTTRSRTTRQRATQPHERAEPPSAGSSSPSLPRLHLPDAAHAPSTPSYALHRSDP